MGYYIITIFDGLNTSGSNGAAGVHGCGILRRLERQSIRSILTRCVGTMFHGLHQLGNPTMCLLSSMCAADDVLGCICSVLACA